MKMSGFPRALVYLVVIALVVVLAISFWPQSEKPTKGNLNQVVTLVKDGSVTVEGEAVPSEGTLPPIKDNEGKVIGYEVILLQKGGSLRAIRATGKDGEELLRATVNPDTFDLQETLFKETGAETLVELGERGYTIDFDEDSGFDWGNLLISLLPVLLLIGLFWFLLRGARGATNQAFNFSRSRVRLAGGNKPPVTFADVAGADESKEELQEIVEFLRNPAKFIAIGARIPRGVLIIGPPGTGKTLLSRAVAGEAAVPFFSISGSEFVEMFVGVGASRVRDLFDQAKRAAPCIVFVDEIDAVGRHRGAGLGGGHDEREQTLNQLLVEMDGFDSSTNVIVLSATNRPDILDPALLRPGRFDRQVVMDRPDINGRKAILEVHSKSKSLDETIDLEVVAKATPGFTGADLANLLNESALLAARRDKKAVGQEELDESIDRVIAGPEKKSRIISQKEKEITAYHEAGHALVASILPNADPVHKVSIIARGSMGGYTRLLPKEDRYLLSRSQFNAMLSVTLAGQVSEQLIFGEMTTGASNDIQQATSLARKMVSEYGMSEKLGPISFGHSDELVFLGRELSEHKNYSERMALEIDREVRTFIDSAYNVARDILTNSKDKLTELAKRLIDEETIEGEELDKLFAPLVHSPSDQVTPAS